MSVSGVTVDGMKWRSRKTTPTTGVMDYVSLVPDEEIARTLMVQHVVARVTDLDVAAIPADNIRVDREEFVELWRIAAAVTAKYWNDGGTPPAVCYGTLLTCRWVACARDVGIPAGTWAPAVSPVTARPVTATPTLINVEVAVIASILDRGVYPSGLEYLKDFPGLPRAAWNTLAWTWMRYPDPPLPLISRQ